MKLRFLLALMGLVTPFGVFAQEPAAEGDLKKELAAATKQRDDVIRQLNERFNKYKDSADTLKAKKTSEVAWQAYTQARESHPAVVSARKDYEAAKAAFDLQVEKQLDSDPAVTKLKLEIDELDESSNAMQFEIAVMKYRLSHPLAPWQRVINADPEIIKLKDAINTSKDRKQAANDYRTARTEKLETLDSAKAIIAEIADATGKVELVEKSLDGARAKLGKLKTAARAKPGDQLKAATENLSKSVAAVNAAFKTKDVVTKYAVYQTAFNGYKKQLDDLMSNDKEVVTLREQRAELDQRIAQLTKKLKGSSK